MRLFFQRVGGKLTVALEELGLSLSTVQNLGLSKCLWIRPLNGSLKKINVLSVWRWAVQAEDGPPSSGTQMVLSWTVPPQLGSFHPHSISESKMAAWAQLPLTHPEQQGRGSKTRKLKVSPPFSWVFLESTHKILQLLLYWVELSHMTCLAARETGNHHVWLGTLLPQINSGFCYLGELERWELGQNISRLPCSPQMGSTRTGVLRELFCWWPFRRSLNGDFYL